MASESLYQRYRPTKLDDVIGQPDAVKTIRSFGNKIPNVLLFHGVSGVGKTTMGRIVSRMLGCPPENKFDYTEINCGVVESPLQTIKDVQQSMTLTPMNGKARVYLLDELQAFSRGRFAQEAMLKVLEDGPDHAYIMLCTTDPKKVLPTIRSRCTQILCKPIPEKELAALVKRVAKAENVDPPVSDPLAAKIAEISNGSARVALVELEKVMGIADAAERLQAIGQVGMDRAAFDIVKELIPFKGAPNWPAVAKVIEDLKDEDPEGLRMMLLAVAKNGVLKGDGRSQKCYTLIRCLDQPCYDKVSGWAFLVAGCWEIFNAK